MIDSRSCQEMFEAVQLGRLIFFWSRRESKVGSASVHVPTPPYIHSVNERMCVSSTIDDPIV